MSNHLSNLWQRVVVIVVTSTVPLLVVAFLLVNASVSKDVNFTRLERVGNAFQRPLEQLLDCLPRYVVARQDGLLGDADARAQAAQLQSQIDGALGALSASYRGGPGTVLKFSPPELVARGRGNAQLDLVLADWEKLKDGAINGATAAEIDGRMVTAVRTMIVHTGDLSNLILDYDLDSYYLVDITVATLPEAQQRLSDAVLKADRWLPMGQGGQHREDLSAMAALLEDDQSRIIRDARTSISEDRKYHGQSDTLHINLPPSVEKYSEANQAFVKLLQQVAAGESVPAKALDSAGWSARAQSFRLWEVTSTELDRLLNLRIQDVQAKRQRYMLVIFGTVALIVLVVGTIARGLLTAHRAETERSEAALRREQDLSKTIIEASPVFFLVIQPDGKILMMNDLMLRTLGYTLDEVIGRDYSKIFLPERDREMLKQRFKVQVREAKAVTTEDHVLARDGRELLVEWHGRPIIEDGALRHFLGIGIDVTERKRAEEEMVRMKNYLANVVDSMPSVIVAIDAGGRVAQWNARATELTGLAAAEAIGKPAPEALPKFAEAIAELLERVGSSGVASKEDLVLLDNGERAVYNLMLYRLVTNGAQESVLRIEDVTKHSQTQEILAQTEKMVSLGGLAAGMAHENNNPLGIISQASQNIERRLQPDLPANQRIAGELNLSLDAMKTYFERREIPVFIKDIREAVSRAAKIVANMLQFSRKGGSERHPASLADLVDQTLELAGNDYDLRKQFDFRSIEITREYDPTLPPVPVATVEIQQVLLNLFRNAAQAMAEGNVDRKPKIRVRLKREADFAVIEVGDNGPGMDEKVARRAFEPFFTTKRPGIGTGLGLSVSYMIVTQSHHGFIRVETSPGNGCNFIIKLPMNP